MCYSCSIRKRSTLEKKILSFYKILLIFCGKEYKKLGGVGSIIGRRNNKVVTIQGMMNLKSFMIIIKMIFMNPKGKTNFVTMFRKKK